MSRSWRRPALIVASALLDYLAVRPRMLRWGATREEAAEALPGDELTPKPRVQSTRAITIEAPPERVWPWIVQMGIERAGFYTHDWFERLLFHARYVEGRHSATRIHPELQELKVGDLIPYGGGAYARVHEIEPYRHLVAGEAFVVEVKRLEDVRDVGGYDACVLGSGIYLGNWLKEARRFIDTHAAELAQRPTWLFASGSIVGDPPLADDQNALRAGRCSWIASAAGSHGASRTSRGASGASWSLAAVRSRSIVELDRELEQRTAETAPVLLELPGCGALTAAKLLAEVGPIGRFDNDAQLARHSGVAPLEASSGRVQRHRLDRGGNRQLNAAFYRIAITQARVHPAARAYLERKQAEGKSRREAIRCLKRQLARIVFHTLKANPALT